MFRNYLPWDSSSFTNKLMFFSKRLNCFVISEGFHLEFCKDILSGFNQNFLRFFHNSFQTFFFKFNSTECRHQCSKIVFLRHRLIEFLEKSQMFLYMLKNGWIRFWFRYEFFGVLGHLFIKMMKKCKTPYKNKKKNQCELIYLT